MNDCEPEGCNKQTRIEHYLLTIKEQNGFIHGLFATKDKETMQKKKQRNLNCKSRQQLKDG